MRRFIEGEDRTQVILLPECLDDYVDQDNPVRVVDPRQFGVDGGGLVWNGWMQRGNERRGVSVRGFALPKRFTQRGSLDCRNGDDRTPGRGTEPARCRTPPKSSCREGNQ